MAKLYLETLNSNKYNYFYKITNKINGKYYYGVHSTDNLNDGYMGSGVGLWAAFKKYGIKNFYKEIVEFFETIEEAFAKEAEVVTIDLVKDKNCYNRMCGGVGFHTGGTATVRDKDGNVFHIPVDDPRLKTDEFVGSTKGYAKYYHKDDIGGKIYFLKTDDSDVLNGTYVGISKNKRMYITNDGQTLLLTKEESEERNDIKEYSPTTNKVLVKDKNGNTFQVDKNDEMYLSKELVPYWCGKTHKEETKEKMKATHKKNKHQQGSKNSQYDSRWVYKYNENGQQITKKISKEELETYLSNGWKNGHPIGKKFSNIYMFDDNNKVINKTIYTEELENYIQKGWIKGRVAKSQIMCRWVDNKIEYIKVNSDEVKRYIDNGYLLGKLRKKDLLNLGIISEDEYKIKPVKKSNKSNQ